MNEEKCPVPVVDLQLTGWERRDGPYRRVLMTRDEFVNEVRKVEQRLSLVKKLLGERCGLTNRERKGLDREQRVLTFWLKQTPGRVLLHRPSWCSMAELKMVKVWSGEALKKKLRWLLRKHPSWVPSWERKNGMRVIQYEGKAETTQESSQSRTRS